MVDLGTLGGLLKHGHSLACYCARCDRWVVLDLATMVADGHGERGLPIRVRCRACGEVGHVFVRPPVPTLGGSVGWVTLATAHQTG
jgi:hypothetical protein